MTEILQALASFAVWAFGGLGLRRFGLRGLTGEALDPCAEGSKLNRERSDPTPPAGPKPRAQRPYTARSA